jgi:hypothetical protein
MAANLTFRIDYRSPPSGIGQVIPAQEEDKIINIRTHDGVDAGGMIHSDWRDRITEHIIEGTEEDTSSYLDPLRKALSDLGVTRVEDYELDYEIPPKDGQAYTVDEWFNVVKSIM